MKKVFSLFLLSTFVLVSTSSNLFAAAQSVGAVTAAIDADGQADGITFTGNGTVTIGDNLNVGEVGGVSVTPGADNRGTLTFAGTSTIQGTIGTATNDDLGTLNANGVSENITFNENAYINTINFGADGTITLVDDAIVTAASITTTTNGTGTLTGADSDIVASGGIGTTTHRLKTITGGTTGDTFAISGNVFANTVTVTGLGTIGFLNGTYTGTTIELTGADDSDGTIATQDGNIIVTTGITTATNNTGTFYSAGTDSITGQIGTSSNKFAAVIGGAAGATSTFQSDIFATASAVVDTGTVVFNGNLTSDLFFNADGTATVADGKTLTGAVTTGTANTGTLSFLGDGTTTGLVGVVGGNELKIVNLNGDFTVAHNIAATTLNINNSGNVTLSGNRTIEGAIQLDDTGTNGILNLSTTSLTLTGTFNQDAATTLKTSIASDTSFGNITASSTATIASAGIVDVTVSGYISNGKQFTIINGTGGTGVNGTLSIVDNSANISFAKSSSGATEDLVLVATRLNNGSAGNSSTVGEVLNGLGATSGDMSTVLGQIDSLSTASDVDQAFAQLDPNVNGGASTESFNTTSEHLRVLVDHLSDLRSNLSSSNPEANKGLSTGDFWSKAGFWIKGFGNHSDQDLRKGVDGYKANMWGTLAGIDGMMAENTKLGLVGGYAATDVDNKGVSGSADIDTYQGTIFLNYDDPSPWYGTGGFSFAWNQYDATRNISFAGINRIALSDYEGQQYTGFIDTGYVVDAKPFQITPMASLTYSHLNINSYAETGADSLNLSVASQEYDLLQSGLGIKLELPIKNTCGTYTPEVHFRWLYDFITDASATTATFAGGGSSFATRGAEPAASSFNIGAGITFFSKGNVSITGTYDLEVKEDFQSHTGQATLRYNF